MYQDYNYYPMANQTSYRRQVMPQQIGLKGHPVSSLEEARAASIDFDGSVFFFPDPSNKKIYTKQINMDGTANLSVYEYKAPADPVIPVAQEYVTKEEFEAALGELKTQLNKPVTTTTIPKENVKKF